jgi:outer membrane protein TolC
MSQRNQRRTQRGPAATAIADSQWPIVDGGVMGHWPLAIGYRLSRLRLGRGITTCGRVWCVTLILSACVTHAQPTNGAAEPIDLPTTLRLAGARNLDIQIARERLREAEANRTSAIEQFFPWVAPSVGYHRRDGVAQAVPQGTISDAHYQSYDVGAALKAQVNFGDAIYQSLAARQHVTASDQGLETTRQDTILAAARGYFELARTKALVEVARQAVQTSLDYEQQLNRAVGLGIAFKGDELRVRTQTQSYRIAVRQALEQQRVAAAELSRVLHLDSRVDLVPQGAELVALALVQSNAPLQALVEQALAARPEVRQSEAFVLAAKAEKNGAVYGPLIPSLGAQAFGGGLGGGPDNGSSTFGAEADYLVGVSWRIGGGGLFDPGRTRAAKARLSATELGQTRLKDTITTEVVTSLTHVQSLRDQITMAEQKLAAADETLRLTRERKQYGVGVVLEDIQAQQDLTRARGDYVTTIAECNKAEYALSRAVGSPASR